MSLYSFYDARPRSPLCAKELDISANGIQALQVVITRLTSLRCGRQPLTDLASLSRAPHIEKLFIFETPITSLRHFPCLTNLKQLDLDNCKLEDFAGIPMVPLLEQLLARSNHLTSFKGLAALPQLRRIMVMCNRIKTLEHLPALPSLEWLIIGSNPTLTDVSPLTRLSRLSYLSLDGNANVKLEPLCAMPQLARLSLNGVFTAHRTEAEKWRARLTQVRDLSLS